MRQWPPKIADKQAEYEEIVRILLAEDIHPFDVPMYRRRDMGMPSGDELQPLLSLYYQMGGRSYIRRPEKVRKQRKYSPKLIYEEITGAIHVKRYQKKYVRRGT